MASTLVVLICCGIVRSELVDRDAADEHGLCLAGPETLQQRLRVDDPHLRHVHRIEPDLARFERRTALGALAGGHSPQRIVTRFAVHRPGTAQAALRLRHVAGDEAFADREQRQLEPVVHVKPRHQSLDMPLDGAWTQTHRRRHLLRVQPSTDVGQHFEFAW